MPFFWTAIANRWTAALSRVFQEKHGLGVVEWRVLTTFAVQDQVTSIQAARLATIDVAAANRAIHSLHAHGAIGEVPGRHKGRSRPFEMTLSGKILFEEMRTTVSPMLGFLCQPLTMKEIGELHSYLTKLYRHLERFDEFSLTLTNQKTNLENYD